ncbi:1884_t:CDS:2, partial [Ambispora gerdemannii]
MEDTSSNTIKIQVNQETPILIKLDRNINLKELRILLSKNEIQMDDNMVFMQFSVQIPISEESELLLFQILSNDTLKIKAKINWIEIGENIHFGSGLHFTENGPQLAKRKAYTDLIYTEEIKNQPIYDEVVICETENQNSYIKNYVATLNCSPFVNICGQTTNQNTAKKGIKTGYRKSKKVKTILTVTDLKPTKEFENAIDEALKSDNKREQLKKVTEDFGHFWCERLEIGGIIIYKETNEISSNKIQKAKDLSAAANLTPPWPVGIEVTAGIKRDNSNMEASNNSFKLLIVNGGLEECYYEQGMAGWLKSLNDHRSWKAVEFSEIRPIFDILDDKRRLEVSEALGKQIIVSQVVELNITLDLSIRKPFIYEFPRNFRFSSTDQIFVTGMSDDNPKAVFAARLHYVDDRSQPVILLHRLGELKNKSTLKNFSLKLGYIVVGISTLNLSEQLVLESARVSFNDNQCSVIIKNQERDVNTGLISTCVSKSKNLQNDPKSELIMGAHFGYGDNELRACTQHYDEKLRPIYQFDNLPSEFFVNYSVISGQQNDRFGQAQVTKKNLGLCLLPSKKSKVTFKKYPQLVTTRLQEPIFISLISNNCQEKCVHGFFKITSEYAVFQSFNNPITKYHQVAYFSTNLLFPKVESSPSIQDSQENGNEEKNKKGEGKSSFSATRQINTERTNTTELANTSYRQDRRKRKEQIKDTITKSNEYETFECTNKFRTTTRPGYQRS